MITKEQLLAFIQWAVSTGCGYALGKGWIGADDSVVIASIVGGLGTLGWQWWNRRHDGIVASAAALPDVKNVVLQPESRLLRNNNKVVHPEEYAAQAAAGAAAAGGAVLF